MATNYPTSKDILVNPNDNDKVSVVSHSSQHANANDAIEAIQDKVGIDGDSNTDSFDYKLSTVTGADKVAPKTATDNAISAVQQNLTDHENDTANPHSVTKSQVGLSNVENLTQVDLINDQTINGTKTFSSSPIVPDPTTNQQVASKKYVDDEINAGTLISTGQRTVSSTVTHTITHGLGKQARLIKLTCHGNNTTYAVVFQSFGTYNGTNHNTIFSFWDTNGSDSSTGVTGTFIAYLTEPSGGFIRGTISSNGINSFDISWVKSGSRVATVLYIWEVLA